jgi:Tol biopolymer transport system component/class 3 adenylate cyclase
MTEKVVRRLAAILSADVVGYSRLMAADEEATVRALQDQRARIAALIESQGGRVVDSPGDNLLAEFPSARAATACAVAIQAAIESRNADTPAPRRMRLRIGVHVGDVLIEGDRLYGDGVNIAARLESLADPGGISVSAAVHDQVKGKLGVELEDRGVQALKNLPDPIRVYAVMPAGRRPRRLRRMTGRLAAAIVGALALLLVVAGVLRRERARDQPAKPAEHRLISVFPGSHREPTFSPDGAMVAFVSDVGGLPQIWVTAIDGGEPIPITSGDAPAADPSWSPSGEIVFVRGESGLWAVPQLGGEPRQIVPFGRGPDVSADGARVVFEHQRMLHLVDLDGRNVRRVEGAPQWMQSAVPASPAFSPDGESIAFFFQQMGPKGDLWVIAAAGGEPRRLTTDRADAGSPAWSADGEWIVFSSSRAGSRTLWRVPASGGEPQPVTTGAGEDRDLTISPDGKRLVYSNTKAAYGLSFLDLEKSQRRVLLERRLPILLPKLSPEGSRIVFFHDLGSQVQIFTIGADGAGLRQVTHGATLATHPRWSPDGEHIYYYEVPYGSADQPSFRRIPSVGGDSVEIFGGWRWEFQKDAALSPDGRQLAYLEDQPDRGTNYVVDLEGGARRALAGPHLHTLAWSPDGRSVLGWRHDDTVAACPVSGDPCRPITQGASPSWSDDASLVYVRRRGGARGMFTVWSVSLASGEERELAEIGPMHPLSSTISQVGGKVVFSTFTSGRDELWMMTFE